MATQGERLRQAIELAGFKKVAQFAESIGESPIKVRQHINRDSIPTDAADLYVRRLRHVGVTTDWLLYGRGTAPKGLKKLPTVKGAHGALRPFGDERPDGSSIEVTHFVGAGDQVFPVPGDAPIGYIHAPPGYQDGGAVAIRGDSAMPMYGDRDLLFYKGWEDPPSPRRIPDRPVLIELVDGRSFLKRLLQGSKRGLFHLISINPASPIIPDVEVRMIARIGWAYFGGLEDVEVAD